MDWEQEMVVEPSTSSSISSLSKDDQLEPNVLVCRERVTTAEGTEVAKCTKAKQTSSKKAKPLPPDMNADLQLQESVSKLQERTKQVKSKLTKMQNTMSTTTKPTVTKQNMEELTEEEILQQIENLHGLIREMRLKAATEKAPKDTEISNSFQSNTKGKTKGSAKSNNRTAETDGKQNEKLKRAININRIVSGGDTDNPKWADLQYKLGDDLEVFAEKCVKAGLGRIIEGEVRVNAKNNHQAFITLDEGADAMITSLAGRMYAMDGDIVRAFLRNPADVKIKECVESVQGVEATEVHVEDPFINDVEMVELTDAVVSRTTVKEAFVIRIVKELGNREFVGSVSLKNSSKFDDGDFFKFKPRDMKVPMIHIPVESCEKLLSDAKSDDILGFLYVAQVIEIKENGRLVGKLLMQVGKCGNIEAEIKAILLHNGMKDVKPFEERFEQMWSGPITLTETDLRVREDLRKDCIFTIDPLTARDLDDAVSCKVLDNGCYEIGVHISDVTNYLEECSELDELVKLRATSIYLVNEVIHMLPKSLCLKCSLLPHEDKFAFSVFWVMNEEANVISTRFTRSVIRSCTQFAYEHAQKIIDNPTEAFTVDDFPTIYNGFTVSDIVERVKRLNSLAEIMRTKRFENGSLSIDKPQLYFQLDPKDGEPIGYDVADRQTANFLIEEFMLLANQSVAQFIYKRFPDISILRSHQPPKSTAVRNLKAKLSAVGIELDMTSSNSIFKGLKSICGTSSSPEVLSAGMHYLLTKPMMRAKYFCSESVSTEADLYHYALAIPIYTHFTSPIRRYPDILVHRLLGAALDYTSPPKRTPTELHDLAKICNDQKFNAKNAGDESINLFFQRYIAAKKSINLQAVVTDIYRNSMEVITVKTGHLITIQFKLQKVVVDASKAPNSISISEKNSTKPALELKMFSAVDIKLTIMDGKLVGFFVTPDWEIRVQNAILAAQAGKKKEQMAAESSNATGKSKTSRKIRRRGGKKPQQDMTRNVGDD